MCVVTRIDDTSDADCSALTYIVTQCFFPAPPGTYSHILSGAACRSSKFEQEGPHAMAT